MTPRRASRAAAQASDTQAPSGTSFLRPHLFDLKAYTPIEVSECSSSATCQKPRHPGVK